MKRRPRPLRVSGPRFFLRPEDRRPAVGIMAISFGAPVVVLLAGERWVVGLIAAALWMTLASVYALSGSRQRRTRCRSRGDAA